MTIIAIALRFLATPLGRWVAIGLAVALALLCAYWWAFSHGEAAALAAAAAASAEAIRRANKARQSVDHSDAAIKRDPANRDGK